MEELGKVADPGYVKLLGKLSERIYNLSDGKACTTGMVDIIINPKTKEFNWKPESVEMMGKMARKGCKKIGLVIMLTTGGPIGHAISLIISDDSEEMLLLDTTGITSIEFHLDLELIINNQLGSSFYVTDVFTDTFGDGESFQEAECIAEGFFCSVWCLYFLYKVLGEGVSPTELFLEISSYTPDERLELIRNWYRTYKEEGKFAFTTNIIDKCALEGKVILDDIELSQLPDGRILCELK